MLAADNWCIKVDDRVYGPYTSTQLRKFAHEGRLASWSLIAPAGGRTWREAKDERAFASFFGAASKRPNGDGTTFGKRDIVIEEDTKPAIAESPTPAPSPRKSSAARPGAAVAADGAIANFVIIFDVVSAAASRAEAAVLSLGPAFRLADNVWSVSCELTAIGVRNAIAPYLLLRESIFVIDTTRGRSSWQNYAPETHAKISAAWTSVK